MKKFVINLYGGPGTGKSTTAAHTFATFKQAGVNAELVTEYVKNWVWEGREIKPNDQYYLFAKQARLESLKFREVDVIVTDSPVWLSAIYEAKFEPEPHICDLLIQKHKRLAASLGVEHVHIFLKRRKAYEPRGRFQTEEEAKAIDQEILGYLNFKHMDYLTFDADAGAAQAIFNQIQKYRGAPLARG